MSRERARKLRKNMTDAERALWTRLRRRQILGYKFRRQQPLGEYIVDFVCLEKKLIVELDGGQHLEHQDYDENRTEWLEEQGFKGSEILESSGIQRVRCSCSSHI